MMTNLSPTQRAVLKCVVERHCGGWLPGGMLRRFVPRSHYAAERMRLYGLLYSRRTRYKGGWWKSWRPTPMGMCVYRGIMAEGRG